MKWYSLIIAGALICLAATGSAQQKPPALFHYQGRLTTTAGVPMTNPTQFFFGIYVGGSATTANSGTRKYQEQITITPDVNGIFEHLVGTGTSPIGSINPNDFNTTSPVYLQVTAAGNVMLPRTRMVSTGYSFVASNAVGDITPKTVSIAGYGQVINSKGQWVGQSIGTSGSPIVNALTDATGGATVSGDLVRLNGTGLSNANIFVSGKPARVKSSTSSQLVFQVPAGLSIGLNQVSISTGTLQSAQVVGSIFLKRYLILISLEDDRIIFIDPTNLTVAGIISSVNFGDPANDSSAPALHLQVDFASDGALMLVPDNRSKQVFAIDLTKSPIGNSSVVQALSITNLNRTVAVAVEPSETIVAVADPTSNLIRIAGLVESFPPFSTPITNTGSETWLQPPAPGGFSPMTLRFINDQVLIAHSNQGRLQIFQHEYNPYQTRFEWYLNNPLNSSFTSYLTTPVTGYQMELTPERERVVLLTGGSQNLQFVRTANWFTPESTGNSNIAGLNTTEFGMSANGWIVAPSEAEDMLRIFKLTDDQLLLTNVYQRQTPPKTTFTGEAFQAAAIEPVDGNLVVGYFNTPNNSNEALQFYRFNGGVLDRVDPGDPDLDRNHLLDQDARLRLATLDGISNNADDIGAMLFTP